jgi:hypothetical protein
VEVASDCRPLLSDASDSFSITTTESTTKTNQSEQV